MSSADFPPPSSNVINLAYVEIVLSGIFLPLVGWITWKHGKAGMTCWQIFITAFIAKLIANIYLIVNKDKPYLPTAVSTMTDSAVIATTSLGIIGIIYEAYVFTQLIISDKRNISIHHHPNASDEGESLT